MSEIDLHLWYSEDGKYQKRILADLAEVLVEGTVEIDIEDLSKPPEVEEE